MPRVGRWSTRTSRFLQRSLIAWLHLLQPLARFSGRLKGLSRPQQTAPQHMTGHPWKAPVPKARDVLSSVRLVTPAGAERSFWSESWVPHTRLMTELVGVLRAARPAQGVDVDEGWHPDRDLSLAVGRWGWLRVRTVVEEHEHGACLFRLRAWLRPSFTGTLRGGTLAVLGAIGMSASMFLCEPTVTVVVAAVAIAAIGARAAWQAIRAAAVLDRAVRRVARAAGLVELGVDPDDAADSMAEELRPDRPARPILEPAFEAAGTWTRPRVAGQKEE